MLHQTGYIHSARDLTRYVDKGWFPGGNQENLQMAQSLAPPTYKEPSYLAESMNGTQLTAALCDITNHGQPSAVSSSEVLPPSVSQNAIQQFQFPLNNLVFEKSLGQPSYPSWSWNIPPQVPRQIGYHDENSFSLGASGNNSMFETLDSQFAPSWDVLPQIVSQGADLHNSMLETAGQHSGADEMPIWYNTWMGSSSMDDQEARGSFPGQIQANLQVMQHVLPNYQDPSVAGSMNGPHVEHTTIPVSNSGISCMPSIHSSASMDGALNQLGDLENNSMLQVGGQHSNADELPMLNDFCNTFSATTSTEDLAPWDWDGFYSNNYSFTQDGL